MRKIAAVALAGVLLMGCASETPEYGVGFSDRAERVAVLEAGGAHAVHVWIITSDGGSCAMTVKMQRALLNDLWSDPVIVDCDAMRDLFQSR